MISLPIPDRISTISDKEIAGNQHASVGELVADLAGFPQTHRAHLDPDLSVASIPRKNGWRPLFGQVSGAESHLANQGVGDGDVFLFFGLFRHVEKSVGHWRYIPKSRPMHVMFGWLQIEKRAAVSEWPSNKSWALYHPHFQDHFKRRYKRNVVYAAADRLSFPGVSPGIPGGGTFKSFSDQLQLTKPGCNTSRWKLPLGFFPKEGKSTLSYHKKHRWTKLADHVELNSVGRGQEFVLNCDHYSEAIPWLCSLFCSPSFVTAGVQHRS
jgi:hypothetical protein